jgi:hypothetical protein
VTCRIDARCNCGARRITGVGIRGRSVPRTVIRASEEDAQLANSVVAGVCKRGARQDANS